MDDLKEVGISKALQKKTIERWLEEADPNNLLVSSFALLSPKTFISIKRPEIYHKMT